MWRPLPWIQRGCCWQLSATRHTLVPNFLILWRGSLSYRVIYARGFLIGVLAWRRGASSSNCGGCCFTLIILFLLQGDEGWFKMWVMDCFDAVISIQVEEGFWVFVCSGFG